MAIERVGLRSVLVMLLGLLALPALAIDPLTFTDDAEQQRFRSLVDELRCMVCQNQNLADSDAPMAQDMRRLVLDMIQDGATDAEIKTFLTDRYGTFVLYRPPLDRNTFILWFGPLLLLLAGALVLVHVIRKRSRKLLNQAIPSEEPW